MSEMSTEKTETYPVVSTRIRETGLKELLKALGGDRGYIRFPDVRVEHVGDEIIFAFCGNVGTLDNYKALAVEFDVKIPKELLEEKHEEPPPTEPPTIASDTAVPVGVLLPT